MYSVEKFTCQDKLATDHYLEIKKMIFFDEQNWPISLDPEDSNKALLDDLDRESQFLIIKNNINQAIGICRFTYLTQAFPHRDLFSQHFRKFLNNIPLRNISTFNSFGIVSSHRNSNTKTANPSASNFLWNELIKEFKQQHTSLVLLTTDFKKGYHFFSSRGCQLIDRPACVFPDRSEYVNMAYCLDTDNAELRHYINTCENTARQTLDHT